MFLEVFRFSFEWDILDWFASFANTFFDTLAQLISEAGSSPAVILFISISYWLIDKNKTRKIAFISFTSMCVLNSLKMLFSAKRPFQYEDKEYLRRLEEAKDNATGTSFPSGHSCNSATLYGEYFYNFNKLWLRIICIVFLILVPVSRMYLGVHFPGDVFIGTLIGLVVVVLMEILCKKIKNINVLEIIIMSIFGIIGIIICVLKLENLKDYFTGLGLLIGFFVGTLFENKYVDFKHTNKIGLSILRYVFGIVVTLVVYFVGSIIRHVDTNSIMITYILYTLTYALTCFVAAYVVPLLFKVIPFLKEEK